MLPLPADPGPNEREREESIEEHDGEELRAEHSAEEPEELDAAA